LDVRSGPRPGNRAGSMAGENMKKSDELGYSSGMFGYQ